MQRRVIPLTVTILTGVVCSTTGCSGGDAPDRAAAPSPGVFTVAAGAGDCRINADAARTVPVGLLTFTVRNDGDEPVGFTVTAPGGAVVGEVVGIPPDRSRTLLVRATEPGEHVLGCAPDSGAGAASDTVTVTGSAPDDGDTDPVADEASANYRSYVSEQLDETTVALTGLRDVLDDGRDLGEARRLYLAARVPYMRVAPAVIPDAGRFGVSPAPRRSDIESGESWDRMHALEKDLWGPGAGISDDTLTTATRLLDDVVAVRRALGPGDHVTVETVADHAQDLVDHLSDAGIHGEIDVYTRTELSDFRSSLEGSQAAVGFLGPIIRAREPDLMPALDGDYAALREQLAGYREGDGFVSYDEVPVPQRRKLSDMLDVLVARLGSVQEVVAR
ncbi:EfeM/EfeO family lipoprotein [Corynebacterium sp. P7003]|uniref:EfeM/EfeO family lipoprotein n=1 Tax=Corynebacterium pygosceleis TaxID=2800406 RepID=A0ABT3WTK0_9CORY|nr:EfeM/EfeO family lipoprotein [Corynebacterium pygosceleis]MCX7445547.1 EfeM/EfeO family lipoprotein [Corynebacterium pygosceleis]